MLKYKQIIILKEKSPFIKINHTNQSNKYNNYITIDNFII